MDVTHTLRPILARQQDVQEKAMKSIKTFQNESMSSATKLSGLHQQSPGRTRALTVSVRNSSIRTGESFKPKEILPQAKSLPTISKFHTICSVQ